MSVFFLLAVIFAAGFSSFADSTDSLERFSPHFSINTEILWQAPTNLLPKSFSIYKRVPPPPFSASVISNAAVLASLQDKGFSKPSTNAYIFWSATNPCGESFGGLSIQPDSATISFCSPDQNLSTNDIPGDETVAKRALECALQLGLDQTQLTPNDIYSSSNVAGCDMVLTEGFCARGIFLSRKMDGFGCYGGSNNAAGGFSIEFGSGGTIRSFTLVWPNFAPDQHSATASPDELIRCIQRHKVFVMPGDESDYYGRLKMLKQARTFAITKITPYYGEGVFGESPASNAPSLFLTPFAELEAVADFGDSKLMVRLLSPVLSSECNRLLGEKAK
jgi:hypothetical protein